MKKMVMVMSALSVGACTEGAIGFNESPAWYLTASDEAKAEYFGSKCSAIGLRSGTEAHAMCTLRLWEGAKTQNINVY